MARKRRNPIRQRAKAVDWRPAFLAAYSTTGVVLAACDAVPVDHSTVYRECKSNAEFAAAFDDARKMGAQTLEQEAVRRAREGVQKLKFYEGVMITVPCEPNDPAGRLVTMGEDGEQQVWMKPYIEHEYSDRLLELLLKRQFPNEYRERQEASSLTVNSTTNITVTINEAERAQFQARERAALEALNCGRN